MPATAPALPASAPAPVPGFDGLWTVEKRTPAGWNWRSAVVRLADGALCIVSPIRDLAPDCQTLLDRLGRTDLLLAPNHFHHLGIDPHLARTPGARAVASDVALPRLRKQVRAQLSPLDLLRARLPPHVTVLQPPGVRTGEVWLRVQGPRGVAWVVSDAFFHLPEHARGAMGLFLRATGTSAGLRIGSTFLWLALADRRAYARWLRTRIDEDQPTVLVPGHGEVLHDPELPGRLHAVAGARL